MRASEDAGGEGGEETREDGVDVQQGEGASEKEKDGGAPPLSSSPPRAFIVTGRNWNKKKKWAP